jgi:hypothetical protein
VIEKNKEENYVIKGKLAKNENEINMLEREERVKTKLT